MCAEFQPDRLSLSYIFRTIGRIKNKQTGLFLEAALVLLARASLTSHSGWSSLINIYKYIFIYQIYKNIYTYIYLYIDIYKFIYIYIYIYI